MVFVLLERLVSLSETPVLLLSLQDIQLFSAADEIEVQLLDLLLEFLVFRLQNQVLLLHLSHLSLERLVFLQREQVEGIVGLLLVLLQKQISELSEEQRVVRVNRLRVLDDHFDVLLHSRLSLLGKL